jgi:hypothetical protein
LSFLIFTILSVIVFSTVSNAERLQFKHGGTQLSGHYFLPYNCAKNNSAKAVIIFVHGGGGVTYDANGYTILFGSILESMVMEYPVGINLGQENRKVIG